MDQRPDDPNQLLHPIDKMSRKGEENVRICPHMSAGGLRCDRKQGMAEHKTRLGLCACELRPHTFGEEAVLVQDGDCIDEEEHDLQETKDSDGHFYV